jgi:L,D-transpeptidase catalytic domain
VTNRRGRVEAARRARAVALVLLLGLALLAAPAAGGASRTPAFTLSWLAPTPADGKSFTVVVGEKLTVSLAAGGRGVSTRIDARSLPAGAALASGTGSASVLTWTPTQAQLGTRVLVFVGRSATGNGFTQPRALFVHVVPAGTPGPHDVTPVGTDGISRWAYVESAAVARVRPSRGARVITRLVTTTPDFTQNLVQVLARQTDSLGRTWYRVRLALLPNNTTGWVLRGALGSFHGVTTYLVIDRQLFTATLYKRGVPVFRTRVGVGRPYWPTPRGDFYVREVLTGYNDPFYGPVAFGTSARSAVLTDWPGGGFIGIHGTSAPQILPGRVSHGCVRVKNGPILRLLRLMPVGTPLAIR